MGQSEVAQLRDRMEQELQAMRQGLSGLAAGVSMHRFIEAKMHLLGQIEDQLATHIGKEQARHLSCKAYIDAMKEGD